MREAPAARFSLQEVGDPDLKEVTSELIAVPPVRHPPSGFLDHLKHPTVPCEVTPMITRVTFAPEFAHAVKIRGLTVGDLARRAHLSSATVSAAIHGKPFNMRSALILTRTVAACPVIKELEE